MSPTIAVSAFGKLADGRPVRRFTLDSGAGLCLQVLDYGCIVQQWLAPDRAGHPGDITLGFASLADYERDTSYRGAVVGRYANRIAGGRYTKDGRTVQLACNDGAHQLHGGPDGFHRQLWDAAWKADACRAVLELRRTSADGENGFPGRLDVTVRFEVHAAGEVRVLFHAAADQATPVSLSQHSYFNLAGHGDIRGHELAIGAAAYLPVDDALIPLGETAPVAGTPFDFRAPRTVGAGMPANGYDHNYVLSPGAGPAARLADAASGRVMTVYTDAPGLQFYSGGFLTAPRFGALCLEPQQFPDAPNRPQFPDPFCTPCRPYHAMVRYVFSVLP